MLSDVGILQLGAGGQLAHGGGVADELGDAVDPLADVDADVMLYDDSSHVMLNVAIASAVSPGIMR